MDALRLAGLHRDTSQIPALLEVLKAPCDGHLLHAALHSLGQIGEEAALPAIYALLVSLYVIPDNGSVVMNGGNNILAGIPNCNYVEIQGHALAVRARLQAHRRIEAMKLAGQHGAVWLSTFLFTLRRTPAELNAAVASNVRARSHHFSGPTWVAPEIYALRELADQIYLLRDVELLNTAILAGIDFTTDSGARLKIEFALHSKEERLQAIVARLASRRTGGGDDTFLTQLAANEGPLAGQMAAAKLKEMDEHHDIYVWGEGQRQRSPGYTAMFHLLSAVGDSAHEPVVAAYLAGPPGGIHYYADQVYPEVRKGLAWNQVIGY